MTLDEYRAQLIERLRSSQSGTTARTMLAEADLVLRNGRLSVTTQDRFWESLQEDLEKIGEEARFLADRERGVQLAAVVAVVQARLVRYRERTSEDSDSKV